jgi:hypothetical protein
LVEAQKEKQESGQQEEKVNKNGDKDNKSGSSTGSSKDDAIAIDFWECGMYVPECIERSAIVNNFQIESRL